MTLSFAPDAIETWPLSRLQPYAKNAKAHGADQVAKIAASMAEFGWTVPCLVGDDGELIAGHGRVLAATQLGLTEAPVIVLGHLTEAQRRAYRIADTGLLNRHGTKSFSRPSCRTCSRTTTTFRWSASPTASWTSCWPSIRTGAVRKRVAPGARCRR